MFLDKAHGFVQATVDNGDDVSNDEAGVRVTAGSFFSIKSNDIYMQAQGNPQRIHLFLNSRAFTSPYVTSAIAEPI